MAERAVRRNEYVLDPMFGIPEGVDDLVYDQETEQDEDTNEDEFASEEDESLADDSDYSDAGLVDTPDILAVLSQKLRTVAGGHQVVDIILEVEDIPGVGQYDFRVTKI